MGSFKLKKLKNSDDVIFDYNIESLTEKLFTINNRTVADMNALLNMGSPLSFAIHINSMKEGEFIRTNNGTIKRHKVE